MLVNGKNPNHFTENDIAEIQKVIVREPQKTGSPSIKKLNGEFSRQLLALIQSRTSQQLLQTNRENNKTVENPSFVCSKCKKNVKSRGTYCSAGNHWIHYHSERLTSHEIEQ